MDPLTHSGLSGFGPSYDMLPLDVNVTFFFDYVKGTVETIEIINITDSGNTSLGGTSDFLLGRFHVFLWMQALGMSLTSLMPGLSESATNFLL